MCALLRLTRDLVGVCMSRKVAPRACGEYFCRVKYTHDPSCAEMKRRRMVRFLSVLSPVFRCSGVPVFQCSGVPVFPSSFVFTSGHGRGNSDAGCFAFVYDPWHLRRQKARYVSSFPYNFSAVDGFH